jgi:error-prone DNA polymerase
VRLGLRQIKGMREDDAKALMVARGKGYDSVRHLWLQSGLPRASIERLADADAFRSIGLDRRAALWAARGESGERTKDRLPLFDVAELADIRREPDFSLPPMPIGEHVVNDYRFLSLSLKAHPVSFLRERLSARRIIANGTLRQTSNGRRVTVAGLVIIRQRPGTANGVIFMTLEDETDIANAIVWPKTFEVFRPIVLGARLVAVTGKVQSESGVIHVVADRLEDLTPLLATLSQDDLALPLARADEVRRDPGTDPRDKIRPLNHLHRHPRHEPVGREIAAIAEAASKVLPKGRNFH